MERLETNGFTEPIPFICVSTWTSSCKMACKSSSGIATLRGASTEGRFAGDLPWLKVDRPGQVGMLLELANQLVGRVQMHQPAQDIRQ